MVKIAIAGGAGNVASEIIDALVATKRHEILILTRRDPPTTSSESLISYAKTSYSSADELTGIFQNVHTVLSFVAPFGNDTSAQTNIIDACVKAGVKRFAPSEWVCKDLSHMYWYNFKAHARQYLADLNKDGKVLEYCLFQPGLFTNYLTRPYKSAKHVHPIEMPFDFEKRRMIIPEGADDDAIVFTTVRDLANVVVRAVEYQGEWPIFGGIRGSKVTMAQLVALATKLRGEVAVDRVPSGKMEDGSWEPTWLPKVDHPSIPREQVDAIGKSMVAGILLAVKSKNFEVGDDWNKLLPDYEFEDAETFLTKVWEGKP